MHGCLGGALDACGHIVNENSVMVSPGIGPYLALPPKINIHWHEKELHKPLALSALWVYTVWHGGMEVPPLEGPVRSKACDPNLVSVWPKRGLQRERGS